MRRPLFDKTVFARLVIAILLVVPPLVFADRLIANSERSARIEQTAQILARNEAELAKERIDRTVADCEAFNIERIAMIATSERLINLAVSNSQPLTVRDAFLLEAFREKANRQIESVTAPKTCTIAALGLQRLEGIANQTTTSLPVSMPTTGARSPGGRSSGHSVIPASRPTTPTTLPCGKVHGRCPKGRTKKG